MKVILNKEVYGLGEEGEILNVSGGYARNYLIPSGKVVEYTKQNLSVLNSRLKAIKKRKEEKHMQQMSLKDRLEGKTVVIVLKTNDKGHLYGSINQSMVAEALAKEGIDIDKRHLLVPEHTIKEIGEYELSAKLYQDVNTFFLIQVKSENYPALGAIVSQSIEQVDAEKSEQSTVPVDEQYQEKTVTESAISTENTEVQYSSKTNEDSISSNNKISTN